MKRRVLAIVTLSTMLLLAACGKKDTNNNSNDVNSDGNKDVIVNDVAIADIVTDVEAAYGEDFVATNVLDEDTIKELIGVDADWCEELYASNALVGMHKDMFVAVKAKADHVDDVINAVNAYRDALIADTNQYPMNLLKIQASRVDVYDNYVFFTLLGFIAPEVEEESDDKILEAYQAENQKAIDVIEGYLK